MPLLIRGYFLLSTVFLFVLLRNPLIEYHLDDKHIVVRDIVRGWIFYIIGLFMPTCGCIIFVSNFELQKLSFTKTIELLTISW
jgi:hypothetical protein